MAAGFMRKGVRITYFLLSVAFLCLGVFPQRIFSQNGDAGKEAANAQTIPNTLRRPDRGEAPRYPQDVVIGELGQGNAPEGAYIFARDLMEALVRGNTTAQVVEDSRLILTEDIFEEISSLEPRSYRLGGGRIEADGSISFLVRFLGLEESITGELFIRRQGGAEAGGAASAREPQYSESTLASASPEEDSTMPGSPPEEPEPAPPKLQPELDPRETRWLLDDLILEKRRTLTEIRDSYRYDFSPYERFF